MKKCPFCKADIEDNARFCLYCMKPLNEKEVIPPPQKKPQWWPFAVAAVLLVALLVVILLIPKENADRPLESTGEESTSTNQTVDSQASETTDEGTQNTQNEGGESQGDTTLEENQNATGTPGTNQKPGQNQNINTQTPTESTTPATKPITPTTTPTTTPQEITQPEETIPPESTTAPETQKTEVVYTYRAARAGDDFNAQYQNTGNDIVITGISQPSVDGTYDIPSYIDGKKVIAIVANAFSGSSAKVVYIPDTIKTIWNYSFAGCSLTDIYFRGNAVYTENKAFSGSITIHCSASCSDRNFHYYKNCAASYGATWAEWNG